MNRICRYLLFFLVLFNCAKGAEIYVATNGSDQNTGTKEKPLASVQMAVRKARELRRLNDSSIKNGIQIIIGSGTYYLSEPIVLRPEDAGTKESPTTIIGATAGRVVLSGGEEIKGWKKLANLPSGMPKSALGKVYVADLPKHNGAFLQFRQLWVNNQKAVRARMQNGDQMSRILSWDFKSQTCEIPAVNVPESNINGMEMVIHQWWAIANLRIKSVLKKGGKVTLSFHQPESRIQSEHPWPAPWISEKTGNSAFFLTNAIQFLDQPGEWFADLKQGKLYYWPKQGEQMITAKVVAPSLENLLTVQGTLDKPVEHIRFQNISFQHASWLRPSKMGHVPLQTGMYLLNAYKLKTPGTPDKPSLENQAWVGRPMSAVKVSYANQITFEKCGFEHNASTGLDFDKGTHQNIVQGNLFKDIGGSAILVGTFSDEATEAHLPYNPKDKRELSADNIIANNLITNVTNEDWGAVGIGAGFVSGINISHNDISEVAYSGISLGWGWTKSENVMRDNVVANNRITRYGKYMYDVAGIYTLSAQPNSVVKENVVDSIYVSPYAHLPEHWFYLYTDEGTSNFTIKDNYTPNEKYLQNANGPNNKWLNNGPQVSPTIVSNAGLESNYQYLLKEKSQNLLHRKINQAQEKQAVYELVFENEDKVRKTDIESFAKENKLSIDQFYQWRNHLVLFTKSISPENLQNILKQHFDVEVRLYDDLYYNFNREKNCGLASVKDWEHIILSANLVADEKMQKEYLDYHATQFQKWPEISRGFCNANFQQLIMFKRGRQLMLIISIPKGESLDKLNPKTTENNPRVDEWNKIMAKYQEGIEGTKPGETWVFFEKMK